MQISILSNINTEQKTEGEKNSKKSLPNAMNETSLLKISITTVRLDWVVTWLLDTSFLDGEG